MDHIDQTLYSESFKLKNQSMSDYAFIDPTSPLQSRRNTRSIFKQSTAGLDSEFSFSKTGYLIKVKEPNLFYYLLIAEGRRDGSLLHIVECVCLDKI